MDGLQVKEKVKMSSIIKKIYSLIINISLYLQRDTNSNIFIHWSTRGYIHTPYRGYGVWGR
jgi:hypothetical protein